MAWRVASAPASFRRPSRTPKLTGADDDVAPALWAVVSHCGVVPLRYCRPDGGPPADAGAAAAARPSTVAPLATTASTLLRTNFIDAIQVPDSVRTAPKPT